MDRDQVLIYKKEAVRHLVNELLPFWMNRLKDEQNGGFITHFDQDGKDTGEDEKSLIAQTRSVYTMSSAHRAGYGNGHCAEIAEHGIDFLINRLWDKEYGGFYWMANRKGRITIDKKILYGQSFAIYCLSEYYLATGDTRGLEFAEKTFNLLEERCWDSTYDGYFEMFDRRWNVAGPGSQGGNRKTLDVHMHLMEAVTGLFECERKDAYRNRLLDIINLLIHHMLHPEHKTGIPQFTPDWKVASQIKFDIIWGWDRYADGGQKENPEDNTCFGHNVEFAWLLIHALDILGMDINEYSDVLKKMLDHTVNHGIDYEYGGVYVEGPHTGGVYDMEKEFWQQAEVMIGMLDAFLLFGSAKFWHAYENVHRFVFDKVIHHPVGEWWPLLTREGVPIWTHMGHSWKINYHTVRAMIQCIHRLDRISEKNFQTND
ncbi:MAG: AGE family epimerase/isomerase [Bacteroidales bacterium]|nr:MAG: AGE family epimerase/isomerase [Bacteroidales bacterium]